MARSGALRTLLLAMLYSLPLAGWPVAADPVSADPAPDASARAGMEEMTIDSHGAALYGVFYRAAGAGAHGTVLLLHGFPGFEQNQDLAQVLRRAGWNALIFHYRGVWGSQGEYSFSHCVEDVQAVLAYLRTPAVAARLRVDPQRLVLVGHSVGGWLAGIVAASDPQIIGVGMISAANRHVAMARPGWEPQLTEHFREEMGPLRGTTPQALITDLKTHAQQRDLVQLAPQWKPRPVLIVRSDDAFDAEDAAFAAVARASDPAHVTDVHLVTDHAYSDARIALARVVLTWIAGLGAAP
jgi:pimeloyl-ACP methyl ester carboxylesterase